MRFCPGQDYKRPWVVHFPGMRSSGIRKVHRVCLRTRTSAVLVTGFLWDEPLEQTSLGLTVHPVVGSLLKEISVIVSVVWQTMTLLRSQHLGLGRGGSNRCVNTAKNTQEGTQLWLRWVGMVTSSLRVVKHSRSLRHFSKS
jgi:hypothetical protein